jgi:hypothetical protein
MHKGLIRPTEEPIDENDEYSIYNLYRDLYNGVEIEFDLARSTKPAFEFTKGYTVKAKQKFVRKLKFG